jgi:hypothetical protein
MQVSDHVFATETDTIGANVPAARSEHDQFVSRLIFLRDDANVERKIRLIELTRQRSLSLTAFPDDVTVVCQQGRHRNCRKVLKAK